MINILNLVQSFFDSPAEFEQWINSKNINGIPEKEYLAVKNTMNLKKNAQFNLLKMPLNRLDKIRKIIKSENQENK